MNFSELAHERQSLRHYSSRSISEDDILKCLEAARLAPSACNSQPWHFIVINDPELKVRVADRIFSGIYAMNKFAKEAPVLIAVVTKKSKLLASFGGQVRDTHYNLVDIGIACEHLILQAQDLGIGSCWIGWFDEKALKKELGISRSEKIDIVISLGYAAEGRIMPKIRRPLEEICSFNKLTDRTLEKRGGIVKSKVILIGGMLFLAWIAGMPSLMAKEDVMEVHAQAEEIYSDPFAFEGDSASLPGEKAPEDLPMQDTPVNAGAEID